MANRFVKQARSQVAPVYNQQIQAAQSQIPAIKNLYDTLTQGLQSSTQQQIETGTQDIVEDASSRGVLRSTLPVDAQQDLQTQLGQALAQGLGQLGAQRAQDISGVRSQIGQFRLDRQNAVQDLANTLQDRDFRQRELEAQERMQQLQLQQARLNAQNRGGGPQPTKSDIASNAYGEIQNALNYAVQNPGQIGEGFRDQVFKQILSQYGGYVDREDLEDAVYNRFFPTGWEWEQGVWAPGSKSTAPRNRTFNRNVETAPGSRLANNPTY